MCSGAPRPIVKFEQRDMKANNTPNQCQALPCPDAGQPVKSFSRLTPPRNNLPSPVAENVSDTSPPSMVDGSRREKDSTARAPEASEIAALLIAQRARTPLAIAVAQDYSAAPFDVPRRFVVLGWFWIVDAWVNELYHILYIR